MVLFPLHVTFIINQLNQILMKDERKIPYPMERRLYLNGRINDEQTIALTKDINNIRYSDRDLSEIYSGFNAEYKPEPIELIINSGGGELYPTLGIISLIETVGLTPINTYCFSYAMSAAFLIFICGNTRFASRHATFMIHQISDFSMGTTNDFIITTEEMIRLQNDVNKIVTKNSKITPQKLRSQISKGDWLIPQPLAKTLGIVDGWLLANTNPRFKK